MRDPGGVLGEIVARKRTDVAARLDGVTLQSLRQQAEPTTRSLKAALARPGARFILEVKRASPSEGTLRTGADPAALARAYRGAADAISVLTDAPYFNGSLDDLSAVRAEFDGPLLAKDFVVDVRQVPEARRHGADAVLVMLSVLDDDEAASVIEQAARLGMDALVEAHDEEEVRRAIGLGAAIVGINNRDLKTLQVDLATTERLAGLVPSDRIVVAESGISTRLDVERLSRHADAFLVGSALMKSRNPALAARALAFGPVKVCGITSPEDALLAVRSGASFAGLIFVPGTPRAIGCDAAAEVTAELSSAGIPAVGVFRNESVETVAATARSLGLSAVQLHGQEDAAYVGALRPLLPPDCEIWAATPMGDEDPKARLGADRTLFDTSSGGQSGGTGRTFDWAQLKGRSELDRALLAGGLNPGNARGASKVGAYALDVCSGVEAAPGRKDPGKLQAFFEALRLPVRHEVIQ